MARRQRLTGTSHENLIDLLHNNGVIKSERVVLAMKEVDRGHFCRTNPYVDQPQAVGHGMNISAPHMHAHSLEILSDYLKEGAKALDVGSGSGYLTACMGVMVGSSGRAVGIEIIPELVTGSIQSMRKDRKIGMMLDIGQIKMVPGDGCEGCPEEGPFDVIHVGAAAPHLPQGLIDQLKPGGRLLIPVGPAGETQYLMLITKLPDDSIKKMNLMSVIFQSLVVK